MEIKGLGGNLKTYWERFVKAAKKKQELLIQINAFIKKYYLSWILKVKTYQYGIVKRLLIRWKKIRKSRHKLGEKGKTYWIRQYQRLKVLYEKNKLHIKALIIWLISTIMGAILKELVKFFMNDP